LNKFERFMKNRQNLIKQYEKGDFTKEEFIEENYRCIMSLGIKPFRKIDNIKKGIYNYQYYNSLAKYYQKRAHELEKRHEARQDFLEMANHFYHKKDKTTEKMLKLVDFQKIEAYYVKVKSLNLKNKLIEIVFTEYDNVVLHSKSDAVASLLARENILIDKEKKSLTDSYINQKY
jgi:hypothetical protein